MRPFDPEGGRFAFASGAGAKMWDVKSGAEIRSWDLQFGFLDQMVFPSADRLFLIRQESLDPRLPPIGPNPTKTPRVCRVRDLLGPESPKPLVEIKDFPLTALAILVTPDGKQVIVEGFVVEEQKLKRLIKDFDTLTGAPLWSLPSEDVRDTHQIRSLDPTGLLLLMYDDTFSKYILVDVGSGRQLRSLKHSTASLGPGAKDPLLSWTDNASGEPSRLALVGGGDESILVTIGEKKQSSTVSPFNPDGSQIAWGNVDGTVTVCDILRVQRRLAEVGLDWK